jgi:hypothetical protein
MIIYVSQIMHYNATPTLQQTIQENRRGHYKKNLFLHQLAEAMGGAIATILIGRLFSS